METIIELVFGVWDWVQERDGLEGAAIALSLAALGYANGARRDRRAETFKGVLAAEALVLHEREKSPSGRAAGITVERHLDPDPIPDLAGDRWQRFRGRWLQVKHSPFRVRHFGCAALLWNGARGFNVILTWISAPSRREAFNQVLSHYGYRPLTAAEFDRLDEPGVTIVWRLEHHGYLILEPALPRWRWKRQRRLAGKNGVIPAPADVARWPLNGDARGYGSRNDTEEGASQ